MVRGCNGELRRGALLGHWPVGKAEPQGGPRRRVVNRALVRVHRQLEPPGEEVGHACHDPPARAPGPHLDVAVVSVADEAVAALLQLLVQDIEHQIRQQGRKRPTALWRRRRARSGAARYARRAQTTRGVHTHTIVGLRRPRSLNLALHPGLPPISGPALKLEFGAG